MRRGSPGTCFGANSAAAKAALISNAAWSTQTTSRPRAGHFSRVELCRTQRSFHLGVRSHGSSKSFVGCIMASTSSYQPPIRSRTAFPFFRAAQSWRLPARAGDPSIRGFNPHVDVRGLVSAASRAGCGVGIRENRTAGAASAPASGQRSR